MWTKIYNFITPVQTTRASAYPPGNLKPKGDKGKESKQQRDTYYNSPKKQARQLSGHISYQGKRNVDLTKNAELN